MSTGKDRDSVPNPKYFQPMNTFIIRVWREWSVDSQTVRGSLEHLESEQRIRFNSLEQMMSFLQSTGLFAESKPNDLGTELDP